MAPRRGRPAQRLTQQSEHGAILVAARLLLGPYQRGKPEDMNCDTTEIDGHRIGKEILVTAPAADCAQKIDRAAAGEQKVMAGAGESTRIRSQPSARRIAVAGFELVKRCLQPREIRRMARVDDIEIEGRDRCAADHRRHAADHDQLDVVPGEDLKGVFESRGVAHGEAR